MEYTNARISKLRDYLFNIIDTLTNNKKYQINANMLSKDINNYSLDKMPVQTEVEKWIIGPAIHRDVFSFRSRVSYSQDVIVNLKNVGFFEEFENVIKFNNEKRILPEIDGIEKIECLNPFTMNYSDDGNSAVFDIQIQITYRDDISESDVSI